MIYAYKCPIHGEFDCDFPMGEAPASVQCPRTEEFHAFIGGQGTEDIPPSQVICYAPSPRVFSTSALIMGPGFKKPWADKVQHSDELQDHFRRKP